MGYHLWLHVPEPWRADDFATAVNERGASVNPPSAFIVGRGPVPHAVRVCLGAIRQREDLASALRILADLLEEPPRTSTFVT